MLRSLLWLVAGLALLAAVIVLSAPELVSRDLAGTGQLVLLAGIAGVPGILVVLTVAVRRREEPDADPDPPSDPDQGTRDPAPHDAPAHRDRTDQEQ